MISATKQKLIKILRWSERYTKTDMVYLASGNFWLTLNRGTSIGIGLALTVAFANLLPPAVFGAYKYTLAIAGIIGALSLTGLGTAAVRAVALGHKNIIPSIFRTSVVWSLPASAATLIGSFYYYFNGNNELAFGLLLIAAASPILNSLVLAKSLLHGLKDFKFLAITSLPRTIVPVTVLIVTLFFTDRLSYILLAYFTSNVIVGWVIYRWTLRKHNVVKSSPVENGNIRNETITYSKHLSVLGALSTFSAHVDQLLLWHFVGPVQVALYSFAQAPVRELKNFSENTFPLVFPKFSVKTMEEAKKMIPFRILQMSAVALFVSALYILAAPWIFRTFLPQYVSAVGATQLLALTIILQPKGLIETLITAHARVKARYFVTISTNLVRVISLGILVPFFGFTGAIWAILISEVISFLILWIVYKKL